MEQHPQIRSVGDIFSVLSVVSRRPRYAFLVLQLVVEIADVRGHAGPFILREGRAVLLRDWLCRQLLPLSEQNRRRAALRGRVAASLASTLSGDPAADAARIDQAVAEQVNAAGRANVSRAISDLVRAGLVTRHYAGYATNHENRGGGRNAVYVVPPAVMRLLPRPEAADQIEPVRQPVLVRQPRWAHRSGQGDLFAT